MRDHNPSPPAATPALARALAAGAALVVARAAAYLELAEAPAAAAGALGVHAACAALVWSQRHRLPRAPLSLANRMTLARTALTSGLAGLAFAPALAHALAWAVLGVAAILLTLDNLDGRVARRRGEASAFGALIDGETDAFFTLVLSVLAFHEGQRAGAPAALVLAIGLFRYALLVATALWPALRGEVPSSLRAKVICNTGLGALLFGIAPFTPLWSRTPVAAAALLLLAWSFSFDVRYLLGKRRGGRPELG